jgi:hypothetical protein
LILAGNLANWKLRFYVVGVHERLILPLHLNVLVSWWLTVGSGIWLAALLEWERRLNPEKPFGRWLLIPLGEAVLTAVVMLSRGFYLMKAIPYALVLARAGVRRSLRLRPLTLAALALTAIGGFGASLAGGSLLRISIYPNVELARSQDTSATASGLTTTGLVPITRRPNSRDIRRSLDELKRMVVGRWIGLEGILAVSASPVLSVGLWGRALVEDPRAGNAALYQQISRAKYQAQAGFTFLTLPGVVAVMSYSGSAWVVLLGMMFVTSIVLATEATFRRLFHNEFLCAVVGVAMANTLAQMNFPYLTVIFFLEMWVTLAGLWLMCFIGASRGRPAVGRYITAASARP